MMLALHISWVNTLLSFTMLVVNRVVCVKGGELLRLLLPRLDKPRNRRNRDFLRRM